MTFHDTLDVVLLIYSAGGVEMLPQGTRGAEVLEQGQTHVVHLSDNKRLFWSSACYLLSQVNEHACALCGQVVRGDAVLEVDQLTPLAAEQCVAQLSAEAARLAGPTHRSPHCDARGRPGDSTQPKSEAPPHRAPHQGSELELCGSEQLPSPSGGSAYTVLAAEGAGNECRSKAGSASTEAAKQDRAELQSAAAGGKQRSWPSPPGEESDTSWGSTNRLPGKEEEQASSSTSVTGVCDQKCASESKTLPDTSTSSSGTLVPPNSRSNQLHAEQLGALSACRSKALLGRAEDPGSSKQAYRRQPAAESRPQQHAASAVPDDSCEPRARLLWSIVGQATSTTFAGGNQRAAAGILHDPRQPEEVSEQQARLAELAAKPAAMQTPQQSTGVQVQQQDAELAAKPAVERQKSRSSLEWAHCSAWGGVMGELVVKIALQGGSAASAQAMTHVCRHWRLAILGDESCLRQLPFCSPTSLPVVRLPNLNTARRATAGLLAYPVATNLPISSLLDKAARSGNVSACVAAAQLLDALVLPEEAMPFWRRAARLGDPRGQVMLGVACYEGNLGTLRDSEEAHRWLLRAANQLATLPAHAGTGQLLGKAALLLGFLAMDGEATKQDFLEAVKWFKVAAEQGAPDAEMLLGTLFNTGQFG